MWRVLRHRNYALLTGGNFVNQLGMWGRMIGTGWAAQKLTGSPLLVTAAHGSQFIPMLLLAPVAGLVSDRFDRRVVAVLGNVGTAAPSAATAFLLATGHLTIAGLIAFSFLGGCFQSFVNPAVVALIPRVVPAGEVQAAVAVSNVLGNVSRFLGAALVGAIIAAFGTAAAFGYHAASLLLVVIPLMAVRIEKAPRVRSTEPMLTQLAGGFRCAREDPAIGNLLVLSVVIGIFVVQMPLMSLVARDLLHAGPSAYGLLNSVTGLGAIAGAIYAGRAAENAARRRAIAVTTMATAGSLLVVGTSHVLLMAAAGQVLFGFGLTGLMTATVALITLATPDQYLGRVMALQGTAIGGMVPVCALLGGALADYVGTRTAIELAGTVLAVYGVWFIARRLSRIQVVDARLVHDEAPWRAAAPSAPVVPVAPAPAGP